MNLNVLLVEDNLDLAAAIIDYLELESITCDHAANGVAGLAQIRNHAYQVIILDLNLPRLDGLSICETMRRDGSDIPVLMLTARDSLADKIAGFDAGTDDYLVKPFAMEELVVRVLALSKRRSGQVSQLTQADLVLDLKQKQAFRAGQLLKLTPIGLKILEVLMRASPNPVGRHQLIDSVWGDDEPDSNSLKVHIHNLRRQVDGQFKDAPKRIQTVAGHGFALNASD